MSGPLGSSQWMYATAAGFYSYEIGQSLRFNRGDSAQLTRTPSSAGNRATWTWSAWVKRSGLGTNQQLFCSTAGDYNLRFHTDDTIIFEGAFGTNTSAAVFRDVSAFYHIVAVHDTTESTSSDRFKLYVNGVQQTTSGAFPSGDGIINNTVEHGIGGQASANFFDGYMAEVNFVDGTALDPTSFGETSNGVWVPKAYSGSYGTNGFYLSFADSSAIGDDLSGNTNDFTATNLAASDVVPDSPTNNFCTWNVLQPAGAASGVMTLSEANLKATGGSSIYRQVMGNMSVLSGKWYTELYITDAGYPSWTFGWTKAHRYEAYTGAGTESTHHASIGYFTGSNLYITDFGSASVATRTLSYSSNGSPTTGSIIGCAADFDNGKLWWSVNGTWVDIGSGAGDPANGTNAASTFTVSTYADDFKTPHFLNYNGSAVLNTGQDSTFAGNTTAGGNSDENGNGDFKYSVPSGFLALCTSNLPEPTIGPNSATQADDYFDIALYSGNGTAVASGGNAITSVNFAPEFVWLKRRDANANHGMYSVVQGAGVGVIPSQDSYASFSDTETLNSFDSNGFTLGSNATNNASSSTNISWNWKLGGTPTVDNSAGAGAVPTAGSVKIDGSNSTAALAGTIPALRQSVNTTAGISITKYVGTGANATIAHSLTETPELVICKNLDDTKDFMVFCDVFAATQYLRLNGSTDGIKVLTTASTVWNDTAPTSTVVSIGTSSHLNTLNDNYIMWAFHSVEGYCKITEYSSNGNADGPFCFLGFRPRLVIIRRTSTSSTGRWPMYNTETYTYNSDTEVFLRANQNDAEISGSTRDIDILSNGIKIRNTSGNINASSGEKYLVIAWAENPFKYANAR